MYMLRFKRYKRKPLYLTVAKLSRGWDLSEKLGDARFFGSVLAVKHEIEAIQKVVIPKTVLEFDERILFLIRLFGSSWDDQVEGMLVDMEDVINAQVLDGNGIVMESVRLRNVVWGKHYA